MSGFVKGDLGFDWSFRLGERRGRGTLFHCFTLTNASRRVLSKIQAHLEEEQEEEQPRSLLSVLALEGQIEPVEGHLGFEELLLKGKRRDKVIFVKSMPFFVHSKFFHC